MSIGGETIGGGVRGEGPPSARLPRWTSGRPPVECHPLGPGRMCRRLLALIGTLVLVAMGSLVLAMPASAAPVTGRAGTDNAAAAPAVRAGSGQADPGWTLAQGKAAVTAGVISRVPGSPAVVDTEAIRKAVQGTDIRLVMLPFKPLDDDARDAAGSQAVDLKDWARDEKGYELIEVEGLQVVFSIYDIVPDSLAELQPVLAQMDVTHQVLFAISNLRKTAEPPDATTPDTRPAGRDELATIGDALAAHGIYNAPGVASPQQREKGWDAAGVDVRAAFLPPATQGTELTDLLTPLHRRFPDDLVIVVRGRWMEAVGPQQELVHSSLLWVYGYFSRAVLGWEVDPSALVRLLSERIALLDSGVVTDQPTPDDPGDPVSSLSTTLPWVFAGVALLIVAVVTVGKALAQQKQRAQRQSAHRETTQDRRELGARLAVLAGQVAGVEPLVHGHAMRKVFSGAVERYRVASDTLASDGSVTVAREAIEESERELAEVASAAGVSLASSGGVDARDEAETGVIHYGRGRSQDSGGGR